MALIDLIITVALVYFIATRFLGYKLPFDKNLKNKKKKSSKRHGVPKTAQIVSFEPPVAIEDDGKVPGLAKVKAAMPDFNEKDFLEGAKKAYRYYHTKRNAMDAAALEPLLAPHVLDAVVTDMEELEEKNQTCATDVKTIEAVDLIEAKLNGRTALIQAQFTATQAENIMDADGKIIPPVKRAKTVKTIWTFAKPIDADDPNWDVTEIEKVN